MVLLLSKHMDEMLNNVLKCNGLLFLTKIVFFQKKNNYSNIYIETKSKGNWLTYFEEKAEGFCFLSSLLNFFVIAYSYCHNRDQQKSHERFA